MPNGSYGQEEVKYLLELAEHSDKVVFIFEPGPNHFSYLNPAFEQVWEKTRESIQADPGSLLDIIYPEDKDYVLKVYQELEAWSGKRIEFRLQLSNEKVRWVRATFFLLQGEEAGKQVISGFAENISVMKEHTNIMHKYAARKDSILEILSHDLAGPLTKIKVLSSLMAERLKAYNDENLNDLTSMIAKTNERNIRMIREFVKQEFLESANSELIRKRIDMVQVVRDVTDQYQNSEEDIKKIFKLYTSTEKVYVEIDDFKFSQVLNNLISNSIKFTHDGGTIIIRIEEKSKSVLLTVTDDGIGIPENLQDELFEKFTKARRPGIKGEPSVGLGMSIIKTIVEWHKGKIWFESQENKGTSFYIELPKK